MIMTRTSSSIPTCFSSVRAAPFSPAAERKSRGKHGRTRPPGSQHPTAAPPSTLRTRFLSFLFGKGRDAKGSALSVSHRKRRGQTRPSLEGATFGSEQRELALSCSPGEGWGVRGRAWRSRKGGPSHCCVYDNYEQRKISICFIAHFINATDFLDLGVQLQGMKTGEVGFVSAQESKSPGATLFGFVLRDRSVGLLPVYSVVLQFPRSRSVHVQDEHADGPNIRERTHRPTAPSCQMRHKNKEVSSVRLVFLINYDLSLLHLLLAPL